MSSSTTSSSTTTPSIHTISSSSTNTVNRDKPLITVFGEGGQSQAQFHCPSGITCDVKNGHRILVTDYGNQRIQVFLRDGQYLSEFGRAGPHDVQLDGPNQLSIQPITNHIVVVDLGDIFIFDSQGQFITRFGCDILKNPLVVDCSHYPNQQQHIVTADWRRQIHLFSSFTSSNNNNNDDRYQLLRSFCSHGNNPNQTNEVDGICFDDERKRILIADYLNQRMSVWSSDGSQFLHTIPMPYNDHNPDSICVDHYGHYPHHIVVGTYQSQIHIYDARMEQQQQGAVLQSIGSKGKQPGQFGNDIPGVCMDDSGALFATDCYNHRVQLFDNHRSSSMISLLASAFSHRQHSSPTIPQQQQPSFFFNSNKRQKTTIANKEEEANTMPSVYASFVNNGLFDRHLIREIGVFMSIYCNDS